MNKAQLDGACTDPRFDDDFFIDLIFAPITKADAGAMAGSKADKKAEAAKKGAGSGSGENDASDEKASMNSAAARREGGIVIEPDASDAYDAMLHRDARFWEELSKRKERATTRRSNARKKREAAALAGGSATQFSIGESTGGDGDGDDFEIGDSPGSVRGGVGGGNAFGIDGALEDEGGLDHAHHDGFGDFSHRAGGSGEGGGGGSGGGGGGGGGSGVPRSGSEDAAADLLDQLAAVDSDDDELGMDGSMGGGVDVGNRSDAGSNVDSADSHQSWDVVDAAGTMPNIGGSVHFTHNLSALRSTSPSAASTASTTTTADAAASSTGASFGGSQGGGSHGGSALGDGDDAGPPDGFDFTDELSALAELEKELGLVSPGSAASPSHGGGGGAGGSDGGGVTDTVTSGGASGGDLELMDDDGALEDFGNGGVGWQPACFRLFPTCSHSHISPRSTLTTTPSLQRATSLHSKRAEGDRPAAIFCSQTCSRGIGLDMPCLFGHCDRLFWKCEAFVAAGRWVHS